MSAGHSGCDYRSRTDLEKIMDLGKQFRPSTQVLDQMEEQDFLNILETNWDEWNRSPRRNIKFEFLDEDLPEFFKGCNRNEVELFRVLDEQEIKNGVDDRVIYGVTGGRYTSGEAGSFQNFQCQDYSLPTFNHLLKGARFWVIIPPADSVKLEELLAKENKKDPKRGCLGGLGTIPLDLQMLKEANIEYRTRLQKEGFVMVTRPGTYYYWINLVHFTEVMSVYYTRDEFFEFGKKREAERCSCRKTYTLNWAKMETVWQNLKNTKQAQAQHVADKGPEGEGENEKEPENEGNSEETTEDQDVAQISEEFGKVTVN